MFAMAEAQIILATLLHSHRLSMDDPKPLLPVGRLTTQPSHTPDFILLPRQA